MPAGSYAVRAVVMHRPGTVGPDRTGITRGTTVIEQTIAKWHQHLRGELPGGLDELLHDDVVFFSPIVFTPQEGKAITKLYLQAAGQTLPGDASKASAGDSGTGGGKGGGGDRKSVV